MTNEKKMYAIHNSKNGHWIYVLASNFDNAIAAARKIEPDYNGGRRICQFRKPDIIAD